MFDQKMYVNDPWAVAEEPPERMDFNEIWGQIAVDAWFCALVRGVGKVPWSEQEHGMEKRATAIDISIAPLVEMNSKFFVERKMIAESKEWTKIVNPSLKALGIRPQELNHKWVHVALVKTGETYVKGGETKDKTTVEFLGVWDNEDACRNDYLGKKGAQAGASPAPTTAPTSAPTGHQPVTPTNAAKETALAFLKVLVPNAMRGESDLTAIRTKIAETIAATAMVRDHFTVDSPETMALIMANYKG